MVKITSLSYTQLPNETPIEYMQRICSIKDDLNLTWKEVAKVLNTELELRYSESWYRKNYMKGSFMTIDEPTITTSACSTSSCEDCVDMPDCLMEWADDVAAKEKDIQERMRALAMKKIEVSDLVVQNNAYLRRMSREQTIKDIAHDYATIMNKTKILTPRKTEPSIFDSEREAILMLSDWHYGMVCDNYWNLFTPEICKERVNTLLNKTIDIIQKQNIEHVTVLDLADLIAGRIHTQIRIESRFDVITQTMDVAEILAEFLDNLSAYCNVSFYSCLDNHSRLEPNKKESMDLESLARLIPWYLQERLKDNECVCICENEFGPEIITCTVCGHNVIAVHGDNDHPSTALQKLTMHTRKQYDMLCTAHRHHTFLEEINTAMVVGNSSLMGVDRYAEKLRVSSDPSQTLIVVTPDNICECLYRIVLN